jgi:hypothetical protein
MATGDNQTFDAGAHVPLIMYEVEVPVSDEKESFKAE